MTDKQFDRANEIQRLLKSLELLKSQLEEKPLVRFYVSDFKEIKNDLIDLIEGKISQLKAEYERL